MCVGQWIRNCLYIACMDHTSFAGIVCIYIVSHAILGFVITPDSFRLTIFTCTMILVLDRV